MAAALAAVKMTAEAREEAERQKAAAEALMRKAFDATDVSGDGKLDIEEMLQALSRIGEYDKNAPSAAKIRRKVVKAAGGDEEFDFEEYKAFVEMRRKEKNMWNVPVAWLPHNERVAAFYQQQSVQIFVAAVILINFLTIVVQIETDPYSATANRHYNDVWSWIDDICNVIFIVELAVNLYGSFWRPFVINPWNYLDTVVVVVGALTLFRVPLGPLSNLKILRAFRIMRLFKRVKSLNKILVGIFRSIPGVMNAFVVMFIFMAIYAVLAVDLFREFGDTSEYETIQRFGPADATWGAVGAQYTGAGVDPRAREEQRGSVTSMTPRGFHYGQEYFGTFSRSLYTLFQVLTGESWSEMVARPLIFGLTPASALVTGLYFTSFVILLGIIMQNVVVTVLLDNFLAPAEDEAADSNADAKMMAEMAGLDETTPAPAPAQGAGASGHGMSGAQFATLRKQADQMQADLDSTLEQVQQILKLIPGKA